jgi:hypothetical protein
MLQAHKLGFASFGPLVLILAVAGATGCARQRDSAQVVSEVQDRMRADQRLVMGRFQVTGTNGVITLTGYAASKDQRAVAVQDAWEVRGVRVVVDNLRALDPATQGLTTAALKPSASVAKPLPQSKAPVIARTPAVRSVPSVGAASPTVRPEISASGEPKGAPSPVASAGPMVPAASNASSADSKTPATGASLPAPILPSAAPPSAPEKITVPYGTLLAVRLTESLSSELNEKGDTFLSDLASPILVNDRVVIPEGAGVKGRVVEAQSAGRFSGRPTLVIEVTHLAYNGNNYDLRSTQYSKEGPSRSVRSAAAIGGGAGLGAILGGILGGGKGAAIGAIIGAGTGTGVQAAGKGAVVQLPAESMLSFRLQTPLTVIPASSLQHAQNNGPDSSSDPFPDDFRPVLKRRPGSASPETTPSEGDPSAAPK